MKILLLGVSVRWTKPINPSVDESPKNRLIRTLLLGGETSPQKLLAIARKVYKNTAQNRRQYECTKQSLPTVLVDWNPKQQLQETHSSS